MQVYGNASSIYKHLFETLPQQPEASLTPLEYMPSNQSFKVLAETPLQGAALSPAVPVDSPGS